MARPRQPLLDKPASEIGVDRATRGPFDGLPQNGICDPLTPGEPDEPLGFKNAQIATVPRTLNYNTKLHFCNFLAQYPNTPPGADPLTEASLI